MAEAAARLGVEAAAVPVFIRLGLLRAIAGEPPMVWTCDVERLRDELLRRGGSMHDRGGAIGYQ